jgi:hypothetical protein
MKMLQVRNDRGEMVFVNIDHITHLQPSLDGQTSYINFVGGSFVQVKVKLEDLAHEIRMHQRKG